jgi:hypothetical protein
MLKSKQQSKQAPICTTISMKPLLFSNTNQPIWNNSQGWKSTKTRGLNTPSYKELTSPEQKQKRKIKAKPSTSKREHSQNDKSEN